MFGFPEESLSQWMSDIRHAIQLDVEHISAYSLDENMLRIVCAHELGHDQLHRNMAKTTPIHEFMLYDMKSKPEYEANIVAAEILMDSDEVLRYIYEYGYTAEQIASAMSTDINLVALKVAHLATLGYNLHALEHKSNFLK